MPLPTPGKIDILKILKKYWGFNDYLPQQREAIECVLASDDSVVVLPTGGGKSLCFQAPALALEGMAVVVSPLISLMKDQIDALRENGIPAACINSSLTNEEKHQVNFDLRSGKVKILYVSPERLAMESFIDFLQGFSISFFAIDEAHCISAWGHDFRPEYRQLGKLKQFFPKSSVHGYTATATQKVQADIANQLSLTEPHTIVGKYDRPNLIYKVKQANQQINQIATAVRRHPKESGIIYCISRKKVENVCEKLVKMGFKALPYHAGMDGNIRRKNQESFIQEGTDIIVATVAFGMGIDKSNVRYVIHSGMPKSLEHYQQETGRAGRDNLEAECLLIYSAGDIMSWKRILSDLEEGSKVTAFRMLNEMYNYCTGIVCRHKSLSNYFGQNYDAETCDACDVCLDEIEVAEDAPVVGQKILSCVIRLKERFGADHTSRVLSGSEEARILDFGHDKLSTYGILKEFSQTQIRNWIEQLTGQAFLVKTGEFNTLSVTEKGWELIKGNQKPKLLKPAQKKEHIRGLSKVEAAQWDGVDRDLFEILREHRRHIAHQKKVPAYIIFGDITLRDLARQKPTSIEALYEVYGIGIAKVNEYGKQVVSIINNHVSGDPIDVESQLKTDNAEEKVEDKDLYCQLSNLRREIATFKNLPEFMIFSNSTLVSIADKKPASIDELLLVNGVEIGRAQQFGEAFIGIITKYNKNGEI